MAKKQSFAVRTVNLILAIMTLSQGQVHILGSWPMADKSSGSSVDFGFIYSDLDLRDSTLDQGHDTPFCQGQKFCEISRSGGMKLKYGILQDVDWQGGPSPNFYFSGVYI